MGKFYTFPHENIRVIDQSARDVFIPQEIPLHLPLFVSIAEKGVGMDYGVYAELKKKYGEATFDPLSPYATHQTLFLRTAAQSQPVFFFRLIPDDAKIASLVLEAHVWDDDIPQWKRATDGKYLLDTDGNKIPEINQTPQILDISWNTDTIVADGSTVYDLTILAEDPENLGELTYNVTASPDTAVSSITQDTDNPNIFHVVFANDPTRQWVDFTITVTDVNSGTTKAVYHQLINPTSDDAILGHWVNKEPFGNDTQLFQIVSTSAAQNINLVSDDPTNVTITKIDDNNYSIVYGTYDTYPHDVVFTIQYFNTNTNADETIDTTQNVLEPPIGTQLTKPGIRIKWKSRALLPTETLTGLSTSEYIDDNGHTVTIYPVLTFQPKLGPGAYGNNIGVALWWTHESDSDLILENQALLYNISIYDKPYGVDTTIHVRDIFDRVQQEFMFKPDARDKSVNMAIDFASTMNLAFRDELPVDFNVYTDILKTFGERVYTTEIQEGKIPELTNEWMANIFDAKSTQEVPYYRVEVVTDTDGILLDKDIIHYFSGGSDGDISSDNFEEMSKLFFMGETFPELRDDRRYPFNHIYDSGYRLDTKEEMYDMLALRDDVHLIVATQCVYEEPNTEMEDYSAGQSLYIKALLYPESPIDGTQCCRVTIFMQCCHINFDDNYKNIVPMTFYALTARCKFHNATFVKGEWKGLPNSSCDFIKDINWAPYKKDVMQLFWDGGLNYCQYYDMTRLHYRDIRSVYPLQTSVLSSDLFVTYLVYLKQLVKAKYDKYAGVEEPVSNIKDAIENELNKEIYQKFKDYIKVIPSVYQTDLDAQLGYSMTVELAVYDSVAKRIWNIPIYVRRIEDLQ